MKTTCGDVLSFETNLISEKYQCDRKAGHKGKHRERFYGDNGERYRATVKWKKDER